MRKISGVMVYYYFICHRKLWCFSNDINLENEYENVLLGKLLDENSYSRETKHILIDSTINIDFIKDWKILHEVKKSRKIEEAAIWQVKYYLYFLKERGILLEKGVLDFPKLRQRQEIFLEDEDELFLKNLVEKINRINNQEVPPKIINSNICRKCAYYEYCYV